MQEVVWRRQARTQTVIMAVCEPWVKIGARSWHFAFTESIAVRGVRRFRNVYSIYLTWYSEMRSKRTESSN